MLCLLLSAGLAFAQTKSKTAIQQSVPELTKLMTGTGLPYKQVAVIPMKKKTLLGSELSDLYIVYTNLSEALPGKID